MILHVVKTLEICKKFQIMFDTTHHFYTNNVHSIENPLDNVSIFLQFVSDIPFVTKNEEQLTASFFLLRHVKENW